MKKLSLYGIRDLALESGRAVFSVQQLSNLIGKPKAVSTVYSGRLVKKKLAYWVSKGKISFVNDDYIIASQLVEPSYISLDSALFFHGLIMQVPRQVECATTRNSLNYKKLGILYHKIPPRLFFGYKKHKKEGSYVLVAEPEKALVDGIYLNRYSKSMVDGLKPKMDFSKLGNLLETFKGKGSKKIKGILHD